jgi:hypothetical protein
LTLDESWFHLSTDHEPVGLAPEQVVPDRERKLMQSTQLMLTVAWNYSGFHYMPALAKGLRFNVGSYGTETLERIKKWLKGQGACSSRKLIAHADNGRAHMAKLSTDFMNANKMT